MFEETDERDQDLDTDDADIEDENSDDEGADKDESDEEAAGDKDEDEDSEDSDDEKDSDEDDKKPATIGDIKKALKGNQNKSNAKRRVDSQKRNINQSPKINERLDRIEQSQNKADLLDRKRQFGYDNSLSPKQVDHVFRLTKRPTTKFLKDPVVKAALDAISAQSNVRSNTPGRGSSSFKSASGKEYKDMKPDEKQANFVDRRRAILENKRK